MLSIAAHAPWLQIVLETDVNSPLVSVIIPAFNASATLDDTLKSACAQTHAALEILVIDDGSIDDTVAIATRRAKTDSRVRVLSQPNGGVARARNLGLQLASGEFIAPLDADDIWHREKIARQVATIEAAGTEFALAYNWFRRIDARDHVLGVSPRPMIAGKVLHRHIDWNFISNGSTPLVRTSVAREVGGYDASLHDAGVQGCEDYLFQLRIARHHAFACVPAFLTGYRVVPGAMSSGAARMIRSHILAYSLLRKEVDATTAGLIDRKIAAQYIALVRNRVRRGALVDGIGNLANAVAISAAGAVDGLRTEVRRIASQRRVDRDVLPAARFDMLDAETADGAWFTQRSDAWLKRLAALDDQPDLVSR